MKNSNVLKVRDLHNSDISLKDIKDCLSTSVKPSCFGYVDFPYRKNYFVFVVYPDGSIRPSYSVCSNPYTAVLKARFYKKLYRYLPQCHIEVVHFDPLRVRHISYVSGFGEPVENFVLTY